MSIDKEKKKISDALTRQGDKTILDLIQTSSTRTQSINELNAFLLAVNVGRIADALESICHTFQNQQQEEK